MGLKDTMHLHIQTVVDLILFEYKSPISDVPLRYRNMCLIPFQCLRVGAELYLANRLIGKAIFGCVQVARYIRAPIALRFGTSGPSSSSPFSQGRNGLFFTLSEWTIGEVKG